MALYFNISGSSLGNYTFPQNPETMDIITPKSKHNVLPLLEGENIYQRDLYDNEIRKMLWSVTSADLYSGLKVYSTRDSSGNIPISYFWDGPVYEFQGAAIQMIDVYGVPLAGKFNQWRVEAQFKPHVLFDNKKGFSITSGIP